MIGSSVVVVSARTLENEIKVLLESSVKVGFGTWKRVVEPVSLDAVELAHPLTTNVSVTVMTWIGQIMSVAERVAWALDIDAQGVCW